MSFEVLDENSYRLQKKTDDASDPNDRHKSEDNPAAARNDQMIFPFAHDIFFTTNTNNKKNNHRGNQSVDDGGVK